jgi:L-iditol 2-dehydrogenase
MFMKKVNLTGIRKFEVVEVAKPQITNDDDVLLKIDTVGICGSDIHYYKEGKIGDQVIDFPFTIGHECSAIVEEIGKKVTRVKPGDFVAVEPALSCHKCQQCLSGREHTCTNLKFLGCPGQIDGCLSEYIIMPERNCYPVPQNVNGEKAAMVEPLTIGYYASQFIKNIEGIDSIVILGVGPIGLGVMLSLQARSFENIFVTDKLDYRLNIAKKAKAVWTGNPDKEDIVSELKKINPNGFDAVFECCGKQEALDNAIDILKPGGTLLIVGIPEEDRVSFNISKIRRKEIAIQNVRRQNKSINPVIDLIASGKLSPEFMITHRFNYEKTSEAFDIVANYQDNVVKALIKF